MTRYLNGKMGKMKVSELIALIDKGVRQNSKIR